MTPKMNLSAFMQPGAPSNINDFAAFAQMAQTDPQGMAAMMAQTGMQPPPVASVVKDKAIGQMAMPVPPPAPMPAGMPAPAAPVAAPTPMAPPPGASGSAEMLSRPVGQDAASQKAAMTDAGGVNGGMDPKTQAMLQAFQSIKAPEAPPPPQVTPGAGVTPGRPLDASSIQNAIALALGGQPRQAIPSLGALINGR